MNRRLLIYVSGAAAAAILWIYLVWLPSSAKIRAAVNLADETRRQLEEIETFTLQLPDFMNAQRQMETRRMDLDSRLYSRADLLSLFDDLNRFASTHGVQIREITPPVEELLRLNEQGRLGSEPQYLNIDITLAGAFHSLGQYVHTLEHCDFTRGINRCIISGARDGAEPLQMQVGFRVLLGSGGSV